MRKAPLRPPGYSNLQAPSSAATKVAVSSELSSILFMDAIDSGKLLQTLIDYTLDKNGSAALSPMEAAGRAARADQSVCTPDGTIRQQEKPGTAARC